MSELVGASMTEALDLFESIFELVGLGTVVVGHGVDDAVQQRHGALGHDVLRRHAELRRGDAAARPSCTVTRYVGAEEEVRVVRVEGVRSA
jgi:hypothetical protein